MIPPEKKTKKKKRKKPFLPLAGFETNLSAA